MSSHRKHGKRDVHDFNPTPDDCAAILSRTLLLRDGDEVLEGSAGKGAWVRGIRQHAMSLGINVAVDVNEPFIERHPELRKMDVRRLTTKRLERFFPRTDDQRAQKYDVIPGNPPYLLALEHVEQSLFLLRPGGICAFLLRAGFSHTKGRAEFIRQRPPWREYALVERPSMDGSGGSDSTEYVLFVWVRGWSSQLVQRRYIPWKDPAACAPIIQSIQSEDWQELRRFRETLGSK